MEFRDKIVKHCFNCRWVGGVGVEQKFLFRTG